MTRLALFALALTVAFAGAVAVGRAVGPLERGQERGPEAHAEEPGGVLPDGLAVADGDHRLVVDGPTLGLGHRELRLWILDREEQPVRSFEVLHERPLHVIVVRRDLERFLHLHPTPQPDGSWTAPVRLGGGVYRVFADFAIDGERTTLGSDLFVEGPEGDDPPRETEYAVVLAPVRGGARAAEELPLVFSVTREDRPVRVQPYLGARGHLVVLREGDLAYLHAHAENERLVFETTFPTVGLYRLFLQYKVEDGVRTAEFSLRVPR